MTVHAVMAVLNEADLLERIVRHTLAEGVDHIWVAAGPSTDATPAILANLAGVLPGRITVVDDPDHTFHQVAVTTRLATLAAEAGADWVVPVDADEFWTATTGTVGATLNGLPAEVGVVRATMWQYRTLVNREVAPKPLGKVAFRPSPTMTLTMGNHTVVGVDGTTVDGLLAVREWQFRGFGHFCAKVADRLASLDPALPAGDAGHYRRLAGMDEAHLLGVWAEMSAEPTVYDPIPIRGT